MDGASPAGLFWGDASRPPARERTETDKMQAETPCEHSCALGASELQKSRQTDAKRQTAKLEELQDPSSNKESQPPWSETAELRMITPTPLQADSDELGATHHYQPRATEPHEAARWKRPRKRGATCRCPCCGCWGAEQPRSTHLRGLHAPGHPAAAACSGSAGKAANEPEIVAENIRGLWKEPWG